MNPPRIVTRMRRAPSSLSVPESSFATLISTRIAQELCNKDGKAAPGFSTRDRNTVNVARKTPLSSDQQNE